MGGCHHPNYPWLDEKKKKRIKEKNEAGQGEGGLLVTAS